ncbi:hypothetical protein M9458_032204, partial [Cirrhinus mrigala]
NSQTIPPIDHMATEPEDPEQHIVTLADSHEEYSVDQITQQSENEAQGAVESFSIYSTQTTSEPEEHNHTTSLQLDENSTYTESTTLTSTERYLESTEVTWQKVESVPEIYKDAKHINFTQKGEPEIKASAIDGVESSNHRHYQPMPDTNLQPGEPIDFIPPTEAQPETTEEPPSQPKEIDGSKHFQPMPETNLEDEDEDEDHVTSEISMTTDGTTVEYDSSSATATQHAPVQSSPSTSLPEAASVEENEGKITETPESDEDLGLFTHTTQSTSTSTSSTEDLTLISTQKAKHLVTSDGSPEHLVTSDKSYGASTPETMTESFSLTHLNSIST